MGKIRPHKTSKGSESGRIHNTNYRILREKNHNIAITRNLCMNYISEIIPNTAAKSRRLALNSSRIVCLCLRITPIFLCPFTQRVEVAVLVSLYTSRSYCEPVIMESNYTNPESYQDVRKNGYHAEKKPISDITELAASSGRLWRAVSPQGVDVPCMGPWVPCTAMKADKVGYIDKILQGSLKWPSHL
jgi:hypothetical protein